MLIKYYVSMYKDIPDISRVDVYIEENILLCIEYNYNEYISLDNSWGNATTNLEEQLENKLNIDLNDYDIYSQSTRENEEGIYSKVLLSDKGISWDVVDSEELINKLHKISNS